MNHITVLKGETIQQLNLKPGSVVVDCTLGSGGHSAAALAAIGREGKLIAFDADPAAIKKAAVTFSGDSRVTLINENFRELTISLERLGVTHIDAIMADLGWRTEQFAGTEGIPRGFSFSADEPLIMTFGDPRQYSFTASDIVNEWAEEDIANVIFGYGEERAARRIARAIVAARKQAPIATARELATLVEQTVGKHGKTHPATRTFQALRIAVNDEFSALEALIAAGFAALVPGGRFAIISFHSLEDRIVKHTFRDLVHDHRAVLAHKKPIVPSSDELLTNPRARSAKLRTIEKLL